MAYYHTCQKCGCNLDPGEKCDCEQEAAEMERYFLEHVVTNPITGQMRLDWDGKDVRNEKTVNKHRRGYRVVNCIDNSLREKHCS